jgi:cation:H+ antiporter
VLPELVQFVVCAAVIIVAGTFLTRCADALADLTGFGRLLVGSMLLAAATSLPELTVDISAVRMGAFDLAAGNVFGSNAFNMVLLIPLGAACQHGSLMSGVSPNHALTCLARIVVTCVAVAGQLYSVERRVKLIEPDALLMILIITGAIVLLYVTR